MNDPLLPHGHEHGHKPRALGLSTGPLLLLRDLILRETGLHYDDSKLDLLADRLADVVAATGTPSLLDFYYMLKYDEASDIYWHQLLDRLAVPETFFWRQSEQFEALTQELLPRHVRDRPGEPLAIWSAACCTGEEPLSIAMALERDGWFRRVDIRIRATDASRALVARAQTGRFGSRAMRSIPDDLRDRFFTRDGSLWQIDSELLGRVEWGRVNLLNAAEARPLANADVIYCRNVLIYMSDEAIQKITDTFASAMPPHGVLFLGAAESLLRLATDFRMTEIGTAFAYIPSGAADNNRQGFDIVPTAATRRARYRIP